MTAAGTVLGRFPGLRALVVGDVCLDRWCTYDPKLGEPSRETGLTRVAVVKTETTAGAAGTVANNMAALGTGRVAVLGVVGTDGHGHELREAMKRAGIDSSLLVEANRPTFTYTKLLNAETGEEDLGRIDFLPEPGLPPALEREVLDRFRAATREFDVFVISDQAETETEGAITTAFRDELAAIAVANPEKIFWVDSRMRPERFRNVILKPNEREANEACRRMGGGATLRDLRDRTGHSLMMVTHGGSGVLVLEGTAETWVPTIPVERPVDICGAGDSFSAGAALALGAGASPVAAAQLGNLVASVTIMKKGTGTATPAEVLAAEARTK